MNKKEKIKAALSKLTDEEQELLGLIKKPKVPRVKKNHQLKISYMIGDSNGYTHRKAVISIKNPFLKHVTEALDKLQVCERSWGLQLNDEDYEDNYKNKNINKLEYDLLCLVSGYSFDEGAADYFFKEHNFENSETNFNYLQEFEGLFIEDTSYSFLVYQGYSLK